MKRLLLLFLLVSVALAPPASASRKKLRMGKKVFERVCGACHIEGSIAGKLAPSDKTMAQWKEVMKHNKHNCDKNVLLEMTAKDKELLGEFLKCFACDYDY